ncbi:hypothetical protein [Burkholderia cepacia]|uniref:hypothetical protein n=1 Tax=Burkholderia cepacia TaxID=292 RepID=UPI000F5A6D1D|nr:hypothetical protein [Burkholderia cepacia]RQT88260.1 hypothetical protein DF041_27305 [Burkholderia cepacia]
MVDNPPRLLVLDIEDKNSIDIRRGNDSDKVPCQFQMQNKEWVYERQAALCMRADTMVSTK